MLDNGHIKLHRKMLKWEWYDDINTKVLFLHCLLRANWEKTKWHGIEIDAGQFVTSLATLAKETTLSIQQVRTALSHLESTGEVTSKSQSKFRIITVNSWGEYQLNNKQSNKQITNKQQAEQQASNKQVTTDKEIKEVKEVKEYKNNTPYNPPRYYPNDEELNEAFEKYVAMRKKIKKPMSDDAMELAISKLNKLSGGDSELAIKILEQSIFYSWQGLFPLKDDSPSAKSKQGTTQGSIDWSRV